MANTRINLTIQQRIQQRYRNRRGMTLVLVVTLILLFLLMGTSFVVMSHNFASTSRARVTQMRVKGDSGRDLVQRAFYDLLRGPVLTNNASPLRGQSILADQYGYGLIADVDGVPVEIAGNTNPLTMVEVTLDNVRNVSDGAAATLQPVTGFYDGLVMTFVNGEARGISCRIVSSIVEPSGVTRFIIARGMSDGVSPFNTLADLEDDEIVINGRPFFGRGAGGDSAGGLGMPALLTAALQPNRVNNSINGYISSGVHEPWDIPDYQNMFLGADADDSDGNRLASFNSAALYDYAVANGLSTDATNFRAFGVPGEPLHVDSDGDGVNDAIWMDIGLPIQTDINGRRFKPLVAYRVVDLDGRLNINAAGNIVDADLANGVAYDTAREATSETLLGGVLNEGLPIGQGYGPGEISLSWLFSSDFTEYQDLLLGNGIWPGRYTGEDLDGTVNNLPGQTGIFVNSSEELIFNKLIGHPISVTGNLFGNPMDLKGRFAYAYPGRPADFDVNGLPISLPFIDATSVLADERTDSVYELNFGSSQLRTGIGLAQHDQLFTIKELERLLRVFDKDAKMLPRRLEALAEIAFSDPAKRQAVTTDSFEVPFPPGHLTSRCALLVAAALPGETDEFRRQVVNSIISPDIMRGLRMDINRPFGNGVDNGGVDDLYGVVDDYFHPMTGTDEASNVEIYASVGAGAGGLPVSTTNDMDLDNNGVAGELNEGFFARQDFARHLYTLILLTTQTDVNGDGVTNNADWFDYNGDGVLTNDDTRDYRLDVAQWVANVIDFRDPDSIHTPFEVDLNPFNGWSVDGNLLTPESLPGERFVVWGMERPELLLTESFAIHDRRWEDRDDDNGGGDTIADGDLDADSHLVPVRGAFIEFYNPWVNQNQPVEMYSGGGVDLLRTSNDGSPVWRMAIVKGEADYFSRTDVSDDRNKQANHPLPASRLDESDIDRWVYFIDPTGSAAQNASGVAFFPNTTTIAGPLTIQPGEFAVVGSGGNASTAANEFTTTFGRLTGSTQPVPDTSIDMTQSITLNPDANVVRTRFWDGTALTDNTFECIAIPLENSVGAGASRSFNVSDPVNGYAMFPAGVVPGPVGDGRGLFDETAAGSGLPNLASPTSLDEPLDMQQTGYDLDVVTRNGSTGSYCVVHLQRLANPMADYDATTNPYITYDTVSMDLAAMNGVEDDSTFPDLTNGDFRFDTTQRGENEATGGPPETRRLLWPQPLKRFQSDMMAGGAAGAAANHVFDEPFRSSMGTLNDAFNDAAFAMTPYPWFNFNDRPYTSQFELQSVPWGSNANIFERFSIISGTGDQYTNVNSSYGHLPNFFFGSSGTVKASADLYYMLDFLEVPSKYLGTENYLSPTQVAGISINASAAYNYNAPFNTISNYRVPGKININTVFNTDVWDGLMGPVYRTSTTFTDMNDSRTSSAGGPGPYPTEFPNPFRPAEAVNYMPLANLVPDRAVDATLLRRPATGGGDGLFDYDSIGVHNNTNRNAYFRHDERQRLGNMVTTRSSVFAIWVTIGFFEVEPDGTLSTIGGGDPNDPAPFPGMEMEGIELGSDDGSIKRYRGFFVVDRSIPVGFIPGRNLNVDNCVLVESIIDQ